MIGLYCWMILLFEILLHLYEFIMEAVDPKIWNSLLEFLNYTFIKLDSVKYTLKNMFLPSLSQMEVGDKRNQPINCGKSSSNFDNLHSKTNICNLINSYQVITSSSFIANEEIILISFFKYEFLDVYILEMDKPFISDGV